MLSRLPDWYRIVNPSPPDLAIEQRRAAVTQLVAKLTTSNILLSVTELTGIGIPARPNAAQAAGARAVSECIRGSHPAFSEDYEQNALELRVCSGTALGEYMSQELSEEFASGPLVAASLTLSALEGRPEPSERYLRQMLSELVALARDLSKRDGASRRDRGHQMSRVPEATDLPSALKAIEALRSNVSGFQKQAEADREEVNVLWWVFGGHSVTTSQSLDTLELGTRALAVGAELANLVLLPPPPHTEHLVGSALRGRAADTCSLRSLARSWRPPLLDLIGSPEARVNDAVRTHPGVFPLSWLGQRLRDSNNAPGWEPEFEPKAYLTADHEKTAGQWALQIFRERIAQRVLSTLED